MAKRLNHDKSVKRALQGAAHASGVGGAEEPRSHKKRQPIRSFSPEEIAEYGQQQASISQACSPEGSGKVTTIPEDAPLTSFVLALDLNTVWLKKHRNEPYNTAYPTIETALAKYGFRKLQGTLYVATGVTKAALLQAVEALNTLPWFYSAVKRFRAFEITASYSLDDLMDEDAAANDGDGAGDDGPLDPQP